MSTALPSPSQMAALLGLPFLPAGVRISDTDRDPGLFGPGSVTWKVMREPLLVLGGGRALLMQVAHPLVAEGALQHSVFEDDPFGRLLRTGDWASTVAFGTRAEAQAACRLVNKMHGSVKGTLSASDATARVAAGTQYRAGDPELARWVHATLVDTLIVTYEALVGPLSRDEQDRMVREWNAVGRMVGVRSSGAFTDRRHMTEYIHDQIHGGPVLCGDGSRRVADTILTSPIALAKPAWPALTFLSTALLDPQLRQQYGVAWSAPRQAAYQALVRAARIRRFAAPRAVRTSATARFAERRCRGELGRREVA